MQDADILARLRAHDYRAAFELLLPRQRDHVYRLSLSILKDAPAAEDMAQDVMLRVWQALPTYNGQAALGTWVYAIARNACLSELRKRRRLVSLEGLTEGEGETRSASVAMALTAKDDPGDTVRDVQRLLDRLPERQAQAVTLFYFEDKSYEQTADALGVPLGTLKAILHRARRRLVEMTGEKA